MATNKKPEQKRIKVLYQFLNGQWYAFADSGKDVYFGRVPLKSGSASEKKNTKNGDSKKRDPDRDKK